VAIADLLKQTGTVQRRGKVGTDRYNNDVVGTISDYETSAYLEQTAAQEVLVDRETYTSDWLLVLPTGSPLDAWDRFVYGDLTFEVVGPPHRVWNPRTASEHHVEARLQQVTG